MTTPDGPSLRDHALRIALTDAVADVAVAAKKRARDEAAAAFAAARRDGQEQQKALLPDGAQVGLLSLKAGAAEVIYPEDSLTEWVAEHCPGEIEHYVEPAAWGNADVVDLIRAVFPEMVKARVRESARKKLVKEMGDNEGYLTDKASGEREQLGVVTQHDPTGDFAYRPGPGAAERLVADWLGGELAGIDAAGLLALPAAGGEQ